MRYTPNLKEGLTSSQVSLRKKQKLTNCCDVLPTKTIPTIIKENIFTLFNFLNFFLAFIVFLTGSYKNLFFMGIVLCNTFISTIQQIRSKMIVDKLSILSSSKTTVIRDSKLQKIDYEELVLDDIVVLKPGSQVAADCIIQEGSVQVNESFITGESELVSYQKGDMVLSGSFVVVGHGTAQVEHVGSQNYTHTISKDAKYVKPVDSILMKSLEKIIRLVSYFVLPVGILLFCNQYQVSGDIEQAILNTVAAMVGMIPEGLILLTSTVLAVATMRLSKQNVLVQELYCIEMLARVDTICLDKTGTITTGNMKVIDAVSFDKQYDIPHILGNIIHSVQEDNVTFQALKAYFKPCDDWVLQKEKPFSPIDKYMAATFNDITYKIGAAEFLHPEPIASIEEAEKKYRVLLITADQGKAEKPIGYITLQDEIRPSAYKTLEYLKKQDVDIKIISGDNVHTIEMIAKEVGLKVKGIDVSRLKEEELEEAILNYNIFGRVSPIQKKKMIEILKKNNHFVAMTGDGVNDVLALKEADCSITIKNATDAARNVSQLVLLNNDFDAIPSIIEEGRRSINNIQRSATLFLTKTTYAFLLSIIFIFIHASYPFQPIQLTLTNLFTIGIPSFVLALEPNQSRIKGNFLSNVFSNALPPALTLTLNVVIINVLGTFFRMNPEQISTLCVIMNGFIGFLLLFKLCMPLNRLRMSLLILLISGFMMSIGGLKEFYSLTILNYRMFILMCALVFLSTVLFDTMNRVVEYFIKRYPKLFA